MGRSFLVIVLVAAGCADTDRDPVPTAKIDTVGTRIVVTNTGAPVWASESEWRLEEDLRIGTADVFDSGVEQFGAVSSVASDSRGRVYVLDGMAQEVRVFDRTGAYSHSMGGEGRGPSEFSGASVLSLGSGDTLTVLDDGLMRFSVFAPDATLVRNHRREIVGTGPPLRSSLDGGGYLDWAMAFPDGRMGARVFVHPVRYAPDFARADTFPPIETTQRMVSGGRMPLLDFGSFPVVTAGRDGSVWFAHSHEYRIYHRSLLGDTTLVFSLPAEPVIMGEAERESVRRRWDGRPEIQAEQLAALPEFKPIVYGIVPDHAGHVIVFVDVAGEDPGTVMDVFRESGEYLGRVRLPDAVPLRPNRPPVAHVSADHLYVVIADSLGVPYVSRLLISRED